MPTYPDDEDGAVLARLAELGADLSQAMLLEFIVAAPGERAAEEIKHALIEEGYTPRVEFDEGELDENGELDADDEEFGPSWSIYVQVAMVPGYDDVVRIQAELDRIAEPFGGRADGWGAMVD